MKTIHMGLGGYTLFQAANRSHSQMMSYLIAAPNGKIMVIDGGTKDDAEFLRSMILKHGGLVDLWVITHCHYDHFEALIEIINEPRGIEVKQFMWHMPPRDWLLATEPQFAAQTNAFFKTFAAYADRIVSPDEGESFYFDALRIDVLKVPDDDADDDPGDAAAATINDTSIVMKLIFPNGRTALILGDLSFRKGEQLAAKYKEALKSDIVQMAHHGQNGAGEHVYRFVQPELCLWCAPLWLYNNDLGEGFNTAAFNTISMRCLMDTLGARIHGVEGEGDLLII